MCASLFSHQSGRRGGNSLGVGVDLVLQLGAEGDRGVQRRHAADRRVQLVEQILRDLGGELRAEAAALDVLLDDQDAVRLADGVADGVPVQRDKGCAGR